MTQELVPPLGVDLSAKPQKMTRAKEWNTEVESAFRFQSAGWRDAREYQAAHGSVTVWAESGWPKVLTIKEGGDLCYFGKRRECAGNLCPRVKLYTY
jgi:hypothetical protein